jgi:molybdopterin-binding protein
MELSARNQLRGTVKRIQTANVMAEVVIDLGAHEIVAAITRASVDRLALRPGDAVVAVVKATDVIVGK